MAATNRRVSCAGSFTGRLRNGRPLKSWYRCRVNHRELLRCKRIEQIVGRERNQAALHSRDLNAVPG